MERGRIPRLKSVAIKWNRHLSSKGDDLSVAPAIYYTNSARYALGWGMLQNQSHRMGTGVVRRSHYFHSGFGTGFVKWDPTSKYFCCARRIYPFLQLNSRAFADISGSRQISHRIFLYDENKTAPPGSTNAMFDIIWDRWGKTTFSDRSRQPMTSLTEIIKIELWWN